MIVGQPDIVYEKKRHNTVKCRNYGTKTITDLLCIKYSFQEILIDNDSHIIRQTRKMIKIDRNNAFSGL